MPQPTVSAVHVNRPLTNISIAFMQSADAFIATRAFPVVPVSKRSDRYFTYDRGEFNRDEAEERAPGTESAGGGYTIDSTPTYYCRVIAFHKDVDDQTRDNADAPLNLDMEATNYVSMKLLIQREVSWVTKFFSTGVWTNEVAGVSGTPSGAQVKQWNDATSTPIEDVRAGKRAVHQSTGFMPNKLVLGAEVYDKLIDHPDIIDRVKYGQTPGAPATVNKAALAALFEVDEVLVASAIKNTAAKGQTAAHSYIAGKAAALFYVPPAPGLMTPSAGYTFAWTGFAGAGGEGQRIKRFRLERIESDRVEGQMAYDHKKVAADLGYFFNTIIA